MPDTPGSAAPNSVRVPQRLAEAPVAAGMVVPYITMTHRDPAKPMWGAVNPARLQQIWQHSLCQVCGQRLDGPWVVVYIRPWDYLRGTGPEPACIQSAVCIRNEHARCWPGTPITTTAIPAGTLAATRTASAARGRHQLLNLVRPDVKASRPRRGTRRGSRSRTTP